jgi:hypothetical protein
MTEEIVSKVIIDLYELSKVGSAQIVFRCTHNDRKMVNAAAHRVGLKTSEFMRLVVIQSAQQVMNGAAVRRIVEEVPEVEPDHVRIDPTLPPGVKV